MTQRSSTTQAPLSARDLDDIAVERLRGVGPSTASALRSLGYRSALDLLLAVPRRYVDRTGEAAIANLVTGGEALVLARVGAVESIRTRQRRTMVVVTVVDGTGSLRCTFFNQPWRARSVAVDDSVAVFGRVEEFRGRRQMTNPVLDTVGERTGRIIAIYPQSEKSGVSTWLLADLIAEILRRAEPRGLADPLPDDIRARWGLVSRDVAFRSIHRPETMAEVEPARRRLVMDELLRMQVGLVERKRAIERSSTGLVHRSIDGRRLQDTFVSSMPFALTSAQQRTISEIRADLTAPSPMHRLLQGDVGAGKTLVAVATMLMAVDAGHQAALMAPTEVLAEQHGRSLADATTGMEVGSSDNLFASRPVRVETLTSRSTAGERRRILAGLQSGDVDLVVGTHSLIQDDVAFASLGVVVIDEQHRFGVEQRAALRATNSDGTVPDVLVMTATPIPRTAAMTVYGDLDVSVLDELPPGRTPIVTQRVVDDEGRAVMWESIRADVGEGRQVYVVCPLVEQSGAMDVASATATHDELVAGELAGLRVGLLHGRMPSAEKDDTMDAFRDGRLDVLVATTVIEVGVDVPNATVMVILDADRFGIAQLHQLRGRVGRGVHASRCYLVGEGTTDGGDARLDAVARTTDGFELAEVDLDLRGEGTILGDRQKGRSDLRIASLRRDRVWVQRAREEALRLVGDGGGRVPAALADEVRLFLEDDAEFLFKS